MNEIGNILSGDMWYAGLLFTVYFIIIFLSSHMKWEIFWESGFEMKFIYGYFKLQFHKSEKIMQRGFFR